MNPVANHPGIDSGLDLVRMGLADNFGIGEGTYADYTGHLTLFALKDGVAVARWAPDYWRKDGYFQAGWYCVRTHVLLLRDDYWAAEEVE